MAVKPPSRLTIARGVAAECAEDEIRKAFSGTDDPYLEELLMPLIGQAAGLSHAIKRLESLENDPRRPSAQRNAHEG